MKCIKCGGTRESEFYPSQVKKLNFTCKKCMVEYNRKNRRKNIERTRAYGRNYVRTHTEIHRIRSLKWKNANIEKFAGYMEKYRKNNAEKYSCRYKAYCRYPVPQVCEIDGCDNLGERHHDDYDKPYEIRWLCIGHHKKLHWLPTPVEVKL